jgi:four helix bundle protein
MQRYEKLKAWEYSHSLALEVHQATEAWPKREWYGLASQVRRSSFSVAANIAEGAAKRSPKEFRRYLDIAIGSLDETHYALRFARDLGYLDASAADRLEGIRAEASRCLWGLARSVEGK